MNDFKTWRNERQSRVRDLSESRALFIEAVAGFQAAQCYFSIPLAVAAYFSDPFNLDPLNAWGLLPVSTNGFMPEIFTLMMLNYHGSQHLYPLVLTYVSYISNSVTFLGVMKYLTGMQEKGKALPRPAFVSLGGIESCGGSTGLALCLQFQADSPPVFVIQKFGQVRLLVRIAQVVWCWCTLVLLLLTYFQFQASELNGRDNAPFNARIRRSRISVCRDWWHRTLESPAVYYAASIAFFLGLLYQATLFYSFLGLGLVDLQAWSFGQIVAISIWVPPIVDYLHSQFGPKIKEMCTPRIHEKSPDLRQPSSPARTLYPATHRGYAQAANDDDEDTERRAPNRNIDSHFGEDQMELSATIAHPNEFQLRSRGTRDFEDRRYS